MTEATASTWSAYQEACRTLDKTRDTLLSIDRRIREVTRTIVGNHSTHLIDAVYARDAEYLHARERYLLALRTAQLLWYELAGVSDPARLDD